MRIISKFRDYYDVGLSYGIDENLVYVRETKDGPHLSIPEAEKLIRIMPQTINIGNYNWSDSYLYPGVLGFCGRLYPIYIGGHYLKEGYHTNDQRWIYRYPTFCTSKQLRNFIEKEVNDNGIHKASCGIIKPALELDLGLDRGDSYWRRPNLTYRAIDEFGANPREVSINTFHELNTPIFLYHPYEERGHKNITLNPNLKDIGFASLIDPMTAFQEISMFLGGVLSRHENIPPTTGGDEVLLRAKGFDGQSFKTASPGKKHKRRHKNG